MFEYSQRLRERRRNAHATDAHTSTATAMWLASVRGGAQATGARCAGLAVGEHASWVELNLAHDALAGLDAGEALSAWVFVADRGTPISRVVQRGRVVVEHGRHALHEDAFARFLAARAALRA
jgi:formimidoylglutamate deiminase